MRTGNRPYSSEGLTEIGIVTMVRVKGLEPPRQRRQNLNSTKNEERQTLSLNFSQDIAETKGESAKPRLDDRAKKNPGALAGGTEVQSTYEAAKLPEQDTPETVAFATFFWCKASGSVERFSGYPRGVSA